MLSPRTLLVLIVAVVLTGAALSRLAVRPKERMEEGRAVEAPARYGGPEVKAAAAAPLARSSSDTGSSGAAGAADRPHEGAGDVTADGSGASVRTDGERPQTPGEAETTPRSRAGAALPAAPGAGPAGGAGASSRAEELLEDDDRPPPGTGLLGEYWKMSGEGLLSFGEVTREDPLLARVDPRVEFHAPPDFKVPFTRQFAVRWRGFLYAPESGVHTFLLGSDDGSNLYLDGAKAIDLSGEAPGFREGSAEVPLLRGFHPIEVRLFQEEDGAACVLSWAPPGGFPEVVPPDVLYPAGTAPPEELGPTSQVLEVLPLRARHGETVTIAGSGFGDPGAVHRVTFGAAEMRLLGVEPGRATAILPPGIDRGDVTVWVDDRPGLGLPYEAGDAFGLLAEYFPGPTDRPIRRLADVPPPGTPGAFRRLEPRISFPSPDAFSLPFPARRFGARYEGHLYAPENGAYTLFLASDDGSRLFVDQALVIDNDGTHALKEVAAPLDLREGFHEIAIDYFQDEDDAGLILLWAPPGGMVSRIPRSKLYAGEDVVRRDPPAILAVEPAAAPAGATVEVRGHGFAGDPNEDSVTISGTPAPIVAASPEGLVIRVPEGARSGPLLVHTGVLSSRPVAFHVVGHGLRGAYFRFEEGLSQIPSLDGRSPDVERVEPRMSFPEDRSFGLPFEPERFAARFTGELEVSETGEHTFHLTSDDGSRLLLDGRLVVDNDGAHRVRTVKGRAFLERGRHAIQIEFFENGTDAMLRLDWTTPAGVFQSPVPETALYPEKGP